MKYLNPVKVKVLMMMFYGTGVLGMLVGLLIAPPSSTVMITFMGVINLSLGGFFGWIYFTQQPDEKDKRKRKPKRK